MSTFVDENKRPLFLVMYFTSFTPYFSIYNIAFFPGNSLENYHMYITMYVRTLIYKID